LRTRLISRSPRTFSGATLKLEPNTTVLKKEYAYFRDAFGSDSLKKTSSGLEGYWFSLGNEGFAMIVLVEE